MFDFHTDKARYFNFQYLTARDYLIPFVQVNKGLEDGMKVLEIGCGEAGVLKAFYEKGYDCMGIELSESRVKNAKRFFQQVEGDGKIQFLVKNIYDIDPAKDLPHLFDLIILKDVIEHIPNQEKFMEKLKSLLSSKGTVFFGFPPWQMPFGGHQQITNSKWTKLPFLHLLPKSIYAWLMRNQKSFIKDELLELKETGLSMERFERIYRSKKYELLNKQAYLFNPIYQYKFGLKARKQWRLIDKIPYLRNFITSCAYYHLRLIDESSQMVE